jgi:hypothetical protein
MLMCFYKYKTLKHHVYDKNNCCSNQIIIYKVPLLLRGR